MKMTMYIDDSLLAKAMTMTGASSKTAAVDLALRELVRKGELVELAKAGLGLSADELKEIFEPAFDPTKLRNLERPATYASQSGTGR